MADKVDAETRSWMMSGIRGKDTRPEIRVRQILHRLGLRFRLHGAKLAGKPDIVLKRFSAVVLVHGCFWHGHGCSMFRWPATRPEFWREIIERNRLRDQKTTAELRNAGWRVATMWECAIRGAGRLDDEARGMSLFHWLHGDSDSLELTNDSRSKT